MATEFVIPQVPSPYRVVMLGAAARGWFDASDEERREKVLPRLKQMFEEWKELGAHVLATVDDDLFMVGEPGSPDFMWYFILDVPSLESLAAMIQRVRTTVGGVRIDRYVRLEAKLGRAFFLLEGGSH